MEKRTWKQELLSLPNILSYIRMLLIPVFVVLYLQAQVDADYIAPGIVLIISAITDKLDGTIARKFNMITRIGKVVDPIADKLTQLAVALCLASNYTLMWLLIGILLLKEGYMAVMGYRNIKGGKGVYSALWFGKVCTVILFISMIALVFLPGTAAAIKNVIIIVNIAAMLFSLIMYGITFSKWKKD